MNKKTIAYWLVTALFCLAMGFGGVMNLMQVAEQQEQMAELGTRNT